MISLFLANALAVPPRGNRYDRDRSLACIHDHDRT